METEKNLLLMTPTNWQSQLPLFWTLNIFTFHFIALDHIYIYIYYSSCVLSKLQKDYEEGKFSKC